MPNNPADKEARAERSRINGAKSKGPITIEGKAISSANGIKHGFAAVINVVLSVEENSAFSQHVDGVRSSLSPTSYLENMVVEQLAAISWRQSRLVALETALLDAQISMQIDNVKAINPVTADDQYFHLVKAWQSMSHQPPKPDPNQPYDPTMPPRGYDITSLELVRRYQVSLDRQFRNTLLNLRQIRQDVAAAPPVQPAAQSEPSPAPPPDHPKVKIIPWDPRSTSKIEPELTPITAVRPVTPINKQ